MSISERDLLFHFVAFSHWDWCHSASPFLVLTWSSGTGVLTNQSWGMAAVDPWASWGES